MSTIQVHIRRKGMIKRTGTYLASDQRRAALVVLELVVAVIVAIAAANASAPISS